VMKTGDTLAHDFVVVEAREAHYEVSKLLPGGQTVQFSGSSEAKVRAAMSGWVAAQLRRKDLGQLGTAA
jgi:hypothetical protein